MIAYYDLKEIISRYEPQLSEAISQVVHSGQYLNGSRLNAFEEEFAAYIGTRYCIGVANGFDALTLILQSLKILNDWEDNSEVIVPALTFVATAQAVQRARLKPVFCDISPDDLLINPQEIRKHLSARTKVLLPVHLYGRCAEMEPLRMLAKEKGLIIIEDAAQAHGAHDNNGRMAGNLSYAAAFSFYPGKNLGAFGDGGCICTSDERLATLCRKLANYGANKKYVHEYLALNSRLDEIQAAILSVRLKYLDQENHNRARWAEYVINNVHNPSLSFPYRPGQHNIWHILPVLTPHREALRSYLANKGVQTNVHYPIPLHKQPCFADYSELSFPNAEDVANTEVSLPVKPYYDEDQLNELVELLNQFTP